MKEIKVKKTEKQKSVMAKCRCRQTDENRVQYRSVKSAKENLRCDTKRKRRQDEGGRVPGGGCTVISITVRVCVYRSIPFILKEIIFTPSRIKLLRVKAPSSSVSAVMFPLWEEALKIFPV